MLDTPANAVAADERRSGAMHRFERLRQRLAAAGVRVAARVADGRVVVAPASRELGAGPSADTASAATVPDRLPQMRHIGHRWSGEQLLEVLAALHFAAPDTPLAFSLDADHPERSAVMSAVGRLWPSGCHYLFPPQCPDALANDPGSALAEPAGPWVPAWHAGVRSRCPLLPPERTTSLLPVVAAAVPATSAWLPMSIDLGRLSSTGGRVDRQLLDAALDAAVEDGDALLDLRAAGTSPETEDVRLNRRLAICLGGLGDLVVRRNEDPSAFATLRRLDRLVAGIHEGLWRRSAELAGSRGPLPALIERAPSPDWKDDRRRSDWSATWRSAVNQLMVRHRNLLVLSPESILPSGAPATPAYTDLLPLLGYADVLGFCRRPLPTRWRTCERHAFNARLRAQVMRLNSTSFIAIGA